MAESNRENTNLSSWLESKRDFFAKNQCPEPASIEALKPIDYVLIPFHTLDKIQKERSFLIAYFKFLNNKYYGINEIAAESGVNKNKLYSLMKRIGYTPSEKNRPGIDEEPMACFENSAFRARIRRFIRGLDYRTVVDFEEIRHWFARHNYVPGISIEEAVEIWMLPPAERKAKLAEFDPPSPALSQPLAESDDDYKDVLPSREMKDLFNPPLDGDSVPYTGIDHRRAEYAYIVLDAMHPHFGEAMAALYGKYSELILSVNH